jgi:hypothetical protein
MHFVQQMWGNMGFNLPGMVAPTFDVEELDKRITDLKAVEAWLQMNLSMLQMSINGLEMQKTTLNTVQAVSRIATQSPELDMPGVADAAAETVGDALQKASLWPWDLLCQMHSQIQAQLEAHAKQQREEAASKPEAPAAGDSQTPQPAAKPAKKPGGKKTAGKDEASS